MGKAENYYNQKIEGLDKQNKEMEKTIAQISYLRLAIVILAVGLGVYFYLNSSVTYIVADVAVFAVVFLLIANIHGNKISKKNKIEIALEYYKNSQKRLNGQYKEFEDKGTDLISEDHPFGNDLDIFGQNSLFQMINSTRTKSGRKALGNILSLKKLPDATEIKTRQEAIKELAAKSEWRESLYVDSTFKKKKTGELDDLLEWSKNPESSSSAKLVIATVFILITFSMIFCAIIKVIPITYLILDLIINYGVVKILSKDKDDAIKLFQTMKYDVKSYANIMRLIDKEDFKSEYLKKLKKEINNRAETSCSEEMDKLSNLLDWVGDSAGNAYFFILNIILFADVFILFNLNNWKKKNGSNVYGWLKIMGEFDALSSISQIAFDHDDWCFAEITEKKQIIAEDMAHPLIGSRAVANTFTLKEPKQITLITGSNMSGKSTFLRTVGLNIILSYIGAPCCAKSFSTSVMNIYTCMRTKDNLEESISSFYAEILRIKLIIEACNKGENVFFLLDEIFKGTNSRDRHIGATVLIKQLAENGAVGLLSTHDLELCDLENQMKEVENYNFREYYKDDKINFDYILRKGKSTTSNAVYLMKMAGIKIVE